jgi:hypothetical protein
LLLPDVEPMGSTVAGLWELAPIGRGACARPADQITGVGD